MIPHTDYLYSSTPQTIGHGNRSDLVDKFQLEKPGPQAYVTDKESNIVPI